MSTLVNEPLETETTGMDLVDESVATASAEVEADEAVNSLEAAEVAEAVAEAPQIEDAEDSSDETAEIEANAEVVADVIALKPEDLADIKNKVDDGSDETISAELSADKSDSTEELELSEASEVEASVVIADDVELSEVEASDDVVAEVELAESDEDFESEAELSAETQVETESEVEVETEVALEADIDASVESEVETDEVVEVGADISEEVTEELEDAESEEAKPSRSRALLLTSLLSTTKPISKKELKKVLKISEKAVMAAIEDLKTTLYEQDLGLMMEEVAGGYRVIIQPALYTDLAALISPPPLPQLSSAALETLAIISYKQPITRGELEAARGTGCSSTLDTLQERDLIKILGQKDVVGKPLLYGTTERFLLEFGLKSLEDLPPLDEKPTEFLRS